MQAEGGLVSMRYEWQDDDVHRGQVYFYKLEEIDTNNATAGIFGPLRFDFFATTPTATLPQPGNTSIPTATVTVGPSPTRTYTATAGPTPTRTLTPMPTNTSAVPTATQEPVFSPTPTASETVTATANSGTAAADYAALPGANRDPASDANRHVICGGKRCRSESP